jgi:16S rRNA (cytidine1402-2'-O)-methyltransferase
VLTLVSTPIGNLGDISLRALEILRAAGMAISKNTRKTDQLRYQPPCIHLLTLAGF